MYEVTEEKRIELGKLIKEKRTEKKYGLNQFSLKTGVNKSLVSRLENGSLLKINPFMLRKIAAGLNIDYKALYKIAGYLDEEEVLERDLGEKVDTNKIPLFESISAGCGFENSETNDFIIVPGIKTPENHFAIRVKGDSMEKTIPDGSIILIKREEEIPDGKIGAFIIDSGAVVKRIRRNKDENILWSDNTSYPPITVKKGDQYHECGRVVKVLLDL